MRRPRRAALDHRKGAETPLSALGPQFQELRPHSPEALLRTEYQSCFFQDLFRAACHFCDYCPSKTLTEIDAIFTFNADGYIRFDQTKWATYMDAMKEDKPPPDISRRTKKSDVSKGAAYLARKTLVLTEEFFRVRYNEAIQLAEGKLDMRTYNVRHKFFKEEQHAECVNLMELREVARDILLRRSTTERRTCPEWLNCWVYGSEMLVRRIESHHTITQVMGST